MEDFGDINKTERGRQALATVPRDSASLVIEVQEKPGAADTFRGGSIPKESIIWNCELLRVRMLENNHLEDKR